MDNKKWYKKFGTIFWWVLTILPILVALIYFIGYHLTFNSGITSASELASYHSMTSGDFWQILMNQDTWTYGFSIDYLCDTFVDLFQLSGVEQYESLGYLFGFMVSVQVYHLAFDLFAWLPKFFHKLLEKSDIGE